VVLRARVGRIAHVPVAEAGGFHTKFYGLFSSQVPKDRFRGRRAADVAGADE
jgi:hypothetical protein